ncbi:MAG: hypothetical protein B6D58_03380 [candidate division Zixibacteria bacterium 4484_95]|nr:MAG: hypothetical protein B6D58_03380 [candidate division Zixibacteria bacterium 4484_95]
MLEIISFVFVFLVGLIVGSFVNVCIYRIPRKISIIKPRSRCPACQSPIKALDNIPLISFVILGGKCRNCGAKISWRYPLVELANGFLYVLAFNLILHGRDNWGIFVVALYLSTVFLIIFFIDLDFRIIPDSLTISGIIIGLAVSFLPCMHLRWLDSFVGFFIGGALFLTIAEVGDRIFKKESMGGGDIKLAAMMGAFLGWKNILLVLVIASFLGVVFGVVLILSAKDKISARTIPFGPYLVIAGLIAFYWGEQIIRYYLEFISR